MRLREYVQIVLFSTILGTLSALIIQQLARLAGWWSFVIVASVLLSTYLTMRKDRHP